MITARRVWYFALLAAVALVAVTMAPAAYAHPITIDSTPKPFSSVPSTPREVSVVFSEPIELSYSKISVLGPDGSRVDTNDLHQVAGDTATIAVALQPNLPEGVYTVTTKVLSAVDGHVIESAFTFGIGATPVQTPGGTASAPKDIISPAESASRFPGMVGQVMVVGAAFGTLWLWRPLDRVPWLSSATAGQRSSIDRGMLKLVMIGAALVLASNAAIIVVQAIDIGGSVSDAIATRFGSVWTTRMIESSILMIIAFAVWRKAAKSNTVPTRAEMLAILVMGLAVLVTSSLIAHGAATGQIAAILVDFFHNTAASIWIGGLILMGFVAVPKLASLADERARSAAISILIPRFSIIVVVILGLVLITGPLLLFFIEGDLSLTLASTYGKILVAKLSLAGVMVAMGAYSQFIVQKKAVSAMAGGGGASAVSVGSSGAFGRVLKAEAGVGIALLLLVSLMTNSALPAGEFPQYRSQGGDQQAAFAEKPASHLQYVQTIYTSTGRIDLSIDPFVVGQNKFTVSFFDNGNGSSIAQDVTEATIKLTQVDRNIGPIPVDAKKASPGVFTADAAFSLPGRWMMEVEGVRPQSANIVASIDVDVRPAISSLSFDLEEYKMPEPSLPLFPVFDEARQSIWAGDSLPRSGRIWQLDMQTGNYTKHPIGNVTLITLMVLDSGKLWYIDPTESKLGLYDPDEKTNLQYILPTKGVISGLAQDLDGNLWMPVVQANQVVKFDPAQKKFTQFDIPTPDSRPVAISADISGNLWLAESTGKVALIDPATGKMQEFEPPGANKLEVPTVAFPSPDGKTIYISEHEGHTITAFNPLFRTFREYPSLNEGGLPYGMSLDNFGNLWFAQHEIDRLGVIDPRTGQGTEVKIPTAGSFVLYTISDDKGRIWFAEQRGAALGVVTVAAKPQTPPPPPGGGEPEKPNSGVPNLGFSLAEAAGPAIVAGIVLSALFYAKSATDLKRNVRAAEKMEGQ